MSRNRDALWACQVVLSAALAAAVAGCALNRPHVKSLRDRDASRIVLDDVILTTVSALNALPARCGPTFDHRVRGEEFRVYQVVGIVARAKRERDRDIHIVLEEPDDRGVTFIAREEVSDASTYRKKYCTPTVPPFPSGITIGIGYDCRFVRRDDLLADWGDVLPVFMIERLETALGRIGSPALRDQMAGVVVPLGAAMRVFAQRSLPKYLEQTRIIYPQVADDVLTAAQRTALVSLVYNRGTDLTGDRRREMRSIREWLALGQIDRVADEFESMIRLWNAATAPGLILRRQAEATLWRSGFGALLLE